ncbi:hypothetical protein ACW0JT_02245 [Arthrobacter sp. SA17]
MIDTHHLAYAGVLLVFLAGTAIVAVSAFLLLGTAWLTVTGVRFVKRRRPHRPPGRAGKRRDALEPVLPMEEALRQAAAGKANYPQEPSGNDRESAIGARRGPSRRLRAQRRRTSVRTNAAA